MEIEITKHIKVKEIVNVQLPYYFKHDFKSDRGECAIYGKIDRLGYCSVQENLIGDQDEYTISCEEYISISNSGLETYFEEEFVSSENEYNDAFNRMLEFISRKNPNCAAVIAPYTEGAADEQADWTPPKPD